MAIDINALIPGLIIGIVLGFILQRGRFCFNSAIRDPLLLKDYKLIKGVALAIFVEMIGFAILVIFDPTILAKKKLFWLPQIVGGLIFGVGMVLAAGCASGTTYRVGEGMMGSLVALMGLTLGVYMVKPGGILNAFNSEMLSLSGGKTQLNIGGEYAWIFMLIIGILGLGLMFWKEILPELTKEGEKQKIDLVELIFKKAWDWRVTGIVLGILAVISLALGNMLGITGHWWVVGTSLTASASLTLGAYMVLGMILGSFIAAKIAGEFKLRVPKDGKTILLQLIGGIMMGVGAAFAGGCNIGNLLSGIPILSVGSILAAVCMVLGNWLMTYLLFMRE